MQIKIKNRLIGKEYPPFIVAEMSGNHNQSLERALAIVEAAAESGVDAIKIQTYTADTMTLDMETEDFFVKETTSIWQGNSLYNLYQQAFTPWEWHDPILKRCKELGIIGFSTPFDESAVDFLESLNVPCYKIASQEVTHLPLIRKVAKTGKPIILSTGMASVAELDEAVTTAKSEGCKEIVMLKCTSAYPASPENSNLKTISHMSELFQCLTGISDHTLGVGVPIASVALGATLIEKHFTLSRSDGGVDAAFSIEPEEMKVLVSECNRSWQALGDIFYGLTEQERASLKYRRSIYVVQDIKAGETFTRENLRIIRPALGLPPKYIDFWLGKTAKKDLKKGTPLSWELFE